MQRGRRDRSAPNSIWSVVITPLAQTFPRSDTTTARHIHTRTVRSQHARSDFFAERWLTADLFLVQSHAASIALTKRVKTRPHRTRMASPALAAGEKSYSFPASRRCPH